MGQHLGIKNASIIRLFSVLLWGHKQSNIDQWIQSPQLYTLPFGINSNVQEFKV